MNKNETLTVSFGLTNTSKGITVKTLEALARHYEITPDEFIQRLLVKKFKEMRPEEYERAMIVQKATQAMDELSLKQFFKAVIENALIEFGNSVNYLRLNKHSYVYDKDGIKVVVDYTKGNNQLNDYVFSIYLGEVINKELLAKYKTWNHNQISIRVPVTGIARAKVTDGVRFSDIAFKFKY